MFLDEAKHLLNFEYQNNLLNSNFDFQKDFMEEKIRHSYQVLGYGNFLLKHEACFAALTPQEKDFLQAVVLLHDIGRFHEIIEKGKGVYIDHGVYGAQYLLNHEMFNKPECLLAIRHHGHLIEKLYEDKDFMDLADIQKRRVENASFLVRDADKLANFYLLVCDFARVENVFFAKYCFENPYSKAISSKVWAHFLESRPVVRTDAENFADMSLMFLAWVFDLHFQSSFELLRKLSIIERIIELFAKFLENEDVLVIKDVMFRFMRNKLDT